MDPLQDSLQSMTFLAEAKPTDSFWELSGLFTSKWRKAHKLSVKLLAFPDIINDSLIFIM